jgi:hypothetical protein
MTAKEVLDKTDCNEYVQGEVFGDFYYETTDILTAMKEFAELKCKELLEIVAEKADEAHVGGWDLDRDEVLNAVNLKEFIQ